MSFPRTSRHDSVGTLPFENVAIHKRQTLGGAPLEAAHLEEADLTGSGDVSQLEQARVIRGVHRHTDIERCS